MTDFLCAQDYEKFVGRIPWSFLLILAEAVSSYCVKKEESALKAKIGYQLRNRVFLQLTKSNYLNKNNRNTEEILSMYQNKMKLVVDYLSSITGYLLHPLTCIVGVLYFCTFSIKLLLVSVIIMPLSSVVFKKFLKRIQEKNQVILESKTALAKQMKEVVKGFYNLKAYQLQNAFLQRYQNQTSVLMKEEKELDKLSAYFSRIFILLRYIPQLIIPLYGGYLAYTGELTVGQLLAANAAIWYVILPVETLLTLVKSRRTAMPAIDDICQLLNYELEVKPEELENNGQSELFLGFYKVGFQYNDQKQVLHNLNLRLNRKEHIGIIGASGAGKSTFIKLLCGFLNKSEGDIKYFGNILDGDNLLALREKISYMPQAPYAFQGTIREYLTMGKDIPMEAIIEAAKAACSYEFIKGFPEGFQTRIGSGQLLLSGGQMKRLCLTKIFLEEAELVLLDEPTASLDKENREKVKQGIKNICKEKALIVITHDVSFQNELDKLYLLEGGGLHEV